MEQLFDEGDYRFGADGLGGAGEQPRLGEPRRFP
jgi:hypothetical protein